MTFEELKFDETMKLSLECLASLRSTHMMRRGKVRIMLSDYSGRFKFTVMNFKVEHGFGSGTLSDLWWLKAPGFDNLNEACKFLCVALNLTAEMFLIFHEAVSEVDQIRMLTTDMLNNFDEWATITESIGELFLKHGARYMVTSSIADTTEYGYGSNDFNGFWLFPCVPQLKEVV